MMKEEVENFLKNIKKTLGQKNCCFVVSNRNKNHRFCIEYSLSSKFIKQIIQNLTVFDFAKVISNCHLEYADEKLYLFAPYLRLVNSNGDMEEVQVYLKINYVSQFQTIVVVSLHACNYTLKYAFR